MKVGVARVTLHIGESHSLKHKRHVVKSLAARVRERFDVAIAESDHQDLWQTAELGIACVSNEAAHADAILARVLAYIEASAGEAEVTSVETEVIDF